MFSSLGNPRQAFAQLLTFGTILSTAFMMWKGLSIVTDSPSPIVVVLSGSMEPAFQRGDLLFLWNRNLFTETQVGEIVVYNVMGKDIPIVHRVIQKFGGGDQPLQLLTKGDNNNAPDQELYAKGQDFLQRDRDVIGSVVGYVPFIGYVTILLNPAEWTEEEYLLFQKVYETFFMFLVIILFAGYSLLSTTYMVYAIKWLERAWQFHFGRPPPVIVTIYLFFVGSLACLPTILFGVDCLMGRGSEW